MLIHNSPRGNLACVGKQASGLLTLFRPRRHPYFSLFGGGAHGYVARVGNAARCNFICVGEIAHGDFARAREGSVKEASVFLVDSQQGS